MLSQLHALYVLCILVLCSMYFESVLARRKDLQRAKVRLSICIIIFVGNLMALQHSMNVPLLACYKGGTRNFSMVGLAKILSLICNDLIFFH